MGMARRRILPDTVPRLKSLLLCNCITCSYEILLFSIDVLGIVFNDPSYKLEELQGRNPVEKGEVYENIFVSFGYDSPVADIWSRLLWCI